MASIGSAAAAGLESGFRMAGEFENQKLHKEQADREFGLRQQESNLRQQEFGLRQSQNDRLLAEEGQKTADEIHNNAVSDAATAITQYGSKDKIPPDVLARIQTKANFASDIRDQARSKRLSASGLKTDPQQDLQNTGSDLAAGNIDLGKVPPAKLYGLINNATGGRATDYMVGPNGEPPKVKQYISDLTTGMETQNEGQALQGFNGLFAKELNRTNGQQGRYGGTIVGTEAVKLIPHPSNPNLVSPVLRVYVQKGAAPQGGRGPMPAEESYVEQLPAEPGQAVASPVAPGNAPAIAPPGAPTDATGHYVAPLTEDRHSHPEANDNVKFIDIKEGMDRVGQMGILSEISQHPEIQKRLQQGAKDSQGNLDQYLALGEAARPKGKTQIINQAPGSQALAVSENAKGEITSTKVLGGPPARALRASRIESALQDLEDQHDSGDITDAEYQQQRAAIRVGGARGGAGGLKDSAALLKQRADAAELNIAADMGLTVTKFGVKDISGGTSKSATVEQLAKFKKAVAKAKDRILNGGTSATEAEVSAAAPGVGLAAAQVAPQRSPGIQNNPAAASPNPTNKVIDFRTWK